MSDAAFGDLSNRKKWFDANLSRLKINLLVQGCGERLAKQVLLHVLLKLKSGGLPDPDLIVGTLDGRVSVPPCGVVGCRDVDEHVH